MIVPLSVSFGYLLKFEKSQCMDDYLTPNSWLRVYIKVEGRKITTMMDRIILKVDQIKN